MLKYVSKDILAWSQNQQIKYNFYKVELEMSFESLKYVKFNWEGYDHSKLEGSNTHTKFFVNVKMHEHIFVCLWPNNHMFTNGLYLPIKVKIW